MADFEKAFLKVLAAEGGYDNDPTDIGGETYKGVSRKNFPNWEGWTIIDSLKGASNFPRNLDSNSNLQYYVRMFYKNTFWDKVKADSFTQEVAEEVFDTAVNMGIGTAGKFLQGALNLLNKNQQLYSDIDEDGSIGPGTIGAYNSYMSVEGSTEQLMFWLNVLQGARYVDIMRKNPSQEKFARGWAKRVIFRQSWMR